PDADSAYAVADRMVLARVPKGRIRERHAYEFFRGRDAGGQPLWTKDVAERGAVLTHPRRCYRSSVSYCAAMHRYRWGRTLAGPGGKAPYGLAVSDAPEPWGPWTTSFLAEKWDVDAGESGSFPTKWMSADGRSLHLVFSGGDNFCVRRADLILAG